jgi:hypothetical protein
MAFGAIDPGSKPDGRNTTSAGKSRRARSPPPEALTPGPLRGPVLSMTPAKEPKAEAPLPKMAADVRRWLESEGFTVRVYDDESVAFFLGARSPSGIVLHAFQPKEKEDMVLLGASADLTEEDGARFDALSEERRARMMWDLRIALLQGGFAFNISPSPSQVRKVLITRALWEGSIRKNDVLHAVQHVTNGVFLVIAFFAREFGLPT